MTGWQHALTRVALQLHLFHLMHHGSVLLCLVAGVEVLALRRIAHHLEACIRKPSRPSALRCRSWVLASHPHRSLESMCAAHRRLLLGRVNVLLLNLLQRWAIGLSIKCVVLAGLSQLVGGCRRVHELYLLCGGTWLVL